MDILAIIGIIATIVGIIAGILQVIEYIQKRREKSEAPKQATETLPISLSSKIPHNLPPRSEFIGRKAEEARVHEALRSRSYLVSIDGIGGIGKTSLVLEIAYECLYASREKKPTNEIATFNGLIWTTAKDRDLSLNALLDAIARTLEYPGIAQQLLDEKQSAVKKLLQEKPYLLIVDNFETITDESIQDFLSNLPEPSKALITTREQKQYEVRAISLKGLTEPEALALIRSEGRRLGLTALEHAEDRTLLYLYQATGGTPLAIKWAVGQIKQKGQSLDTVLAVLHEARGNIFDHMFSRSWSLLSTSARQVLIVMPIFATSASREQVEAVSDVHHFALDEALGQLVEMSLVDVTDQLGLTQQRYNITPLTRAFAAAKLKDKPEIRQAAWNRLAEFFREYTEVHGGLWNPDGFAQLDSDLPNILAVIQWCWRQRLLDPGMDILHNVRYFLINRGYWNDALVLGQQAIALAEELGDELSAARQRVWPIGWIHRFRGDLSTAEEETVRALEVFEKQDDQWWVAYAKRHLGLTAQDLGDSHRAEQLLKESLAFSQSKGEKYRVYLLTVDLAELALQQGELETAWELGHSLPDLTHETDDPYCVSRLMRVLANVECQRGNLEQAEEYCRNALNHAKTIDFFNGIADALLDLGKIKIEMGQEQAAMQNLLDALETYRRLDAKSKISEIEQVLAELPHPAIVRDDKGDTD